jgi:hypothetical protein
MPKSEEIDWGKLADIFKENNRPHAGYYTWKSDRGLAEAGVMDEFMADLESNGRASFKDPMHRGEGNDPPDCEVQLDGNLIGVELTELVDEASAKAADLGQYYQDKLWTNEELAADLQARITRKGNGAPKGGPYAGYALVIYTDENGISVEQAQEIVARFTFSNRGCITRAFLMLSYINGTNPVFELRLSAE